MRPAYHLTSVQAASWLKQTENTHVRTQFYALYKSGFNSNASLAIKAGTYNKDAGGHT